MSIKRISHLHLNEDKLYFFGRLYGRGAAFRAGSSDAKVDWKLDTFAPGESGSSLKSPINDINSYVLVERDIYACGYSYNNPVNNYDEKRSAAVMKLSKDNGELAFVKQFGRSDDINECRAIVEDTRRSTELVVLVEGTFKALGPQTKRQFLMVIDKQGQPIGAVAHEIFQPSLRLANQQIF